MNNEIKEVKDAIKLAKYEIRHWQKFLLGAEKQLKKASLKEATKSDFVR